jgi:hypothetical protein
MTQWFLENWSSILLSLVTAGALGVCGWFGLQLKTYRKLLNEKKETQLDEAIEEKIEPVKKDIQELRDYMAKIDTTEKHKMDLIVSSYRYRLTQLCRLYLTRGYMTIGEYDQLNEFYHLYTGLGGNGEAKIWYDRAIQLPIHDSIEE